MRHRYLVLDSYRFIAALGIVAYHFEGHFAPFLPGPRDRLVALQTLVDFFFVLSGFVLAHTYGGTIRSAGAFGDFLRKRLARIYPLHAATLAACVALYLLVRFAGVPIRDRSIIDMSVLPANLLLVQAWGFVDHPGLNEPAWSISAETFVYLLFPLFALLADRLRPAFTLGLALLAAMMVEGARARLGLAPAALATFDLGMLRAVPMFLSGIAVHAFVGARPPVPVSWLIPHALFLAILALMAWQVPLPLIDALYPPLVALIAMAERGGRATRLASPVAVRLGEASFAIYMTHTFVQIACVGLVRRTGWTSLPLLGFVALAGTALIVGLGLLSYAFFEAPLRRRLAGPARRRPSIEPAVYPVRRNIVPKVGVPN